MNLSLQKKIFRDYKSKSSIKFNSLKKQKINFLPKTDRTIYNLKKSQFIHKKEKSQALSQNKSNIMSSNPIRTTILNTTSSSNYMSPKSPLLPENLISDLEIRTENENGNTLPSLNLTGEIPFSVLYPSNNNLNYNFNNNNSKNIYENTEIKKIIWSSNNKKKINRSCSDKLKNKKRCKYNNFINDYNDNKINGVPLNFMKAMRQNKNDIIKDAKKFLKEEEKKKKVNNNRCFKFNKSFKNIKINKKNKAKIDISNINNINTDIMISNLKLNKNHFITNSNINKIQQVKNFYYNQLINIENEKNDKKINLNKQYIKKLKDQNCILFQDFRVIKKEKFSEKYRFSEYSEKNNNQHQDQNEINHYLKRNFYQKINIPITTLNLINIYTESKISKSKNNKKLNLNPKTENKSKFYKEFRRIIKKSAIEFLPKSKKISFQDYIKYSLNKPSQEKQNFDKDFNDLLKYLKQANYYQVSDILSNQKHLLFYSDFFNQSPLTWAVKRGIPRLIPQMILEGGDVNHVDIEGKTPLHFAAINGDLVSVVLLLYEMGDPLIKDKSGFFPGDYNEKNEKICSNKKEYINEVIKTVDCIRKINKYRSWKIYYQCIRNGIDFFIMKNIGNFDEFQEINELIRDIYQFKDEFFFIQK